MINVFKRREKKQRCKTKLYKVLSKFATQNLEMDCRIKTALAFNTWEYTDKAYKITLPEISLRNMIRFFRKLMTNEFVFLFFLQTTGYSTSKEKFKLVFF